LKRRKTTTISKEVERERQKNQIQRSNLTIIATFMAAMVIKNLTATKRKRKKIIGQMKM